jgi:hypothetical protein
MPEGDSFEVVAGELATHAGHLDSVQQRLATALGAARQVSMDNGAYGVLGQPFAMMLDPFENLGTDMISQGQDTVTSHADSMRGAAQSYSGTEDVQTNRFKGGE